MKKIILSFFIAFIIFAGTNVYADKCSYEEQVKLNTEAAKIKAIYEEKQEKLDSTLYSCADGQEECNLSYSYFKISILNLSESFYVDVSGSGMNKVYYVKDAVDGVISFDVMDISKVNTFTFKVYNSAKTNCGSQLNRTFYLTTPRINYYADYSICDDIPDYYMCQKYVTYEDTGFVDFVDKVTEYTEEQEDIKNKDRSFWYKIRLFLKKNGKWFIIGGISAAMIAVAFVVVTSKRRKDSI